MIHIPFLRCLLSAGVLLLGLGATEATYALDEQPQTGFAIVVNTTDDHDDGVCGVLDCTLREAISYKTIYRAIFVNFKREVFGSRKTRIVLKSELPPITTDISIYGPYQDGAGLTIENPNAKSGAALRVETGSPLLHSLTFKGYEAVENSSQGDATATPYFVACTFLGRTTGIANKGSMRLSNSTITRSQSAGIVNTGFLTMSHVTVAGNNQGYVVDGGSTQIIDSLIVGNQTNVSGTISNDLGGNIITGTASAAGLDVDPQGAVVLKDNGGPTHTIALVAGSPAIDRGSVDPYEDQRRISRDEMPDAGAYEFPPKLNYAPTILSTSPFRTSDNVGNKPIFALTAYDRNGVSDIKEVWLIVNERLSWNGGATLVYVPSATSPTSGLLYLRGTDDFLPPMQVGKGANNKAILANDSVIVAARDVEISTLGNSLYILLPLTLRDGLVGANRIFARVEDKKGVLDPAAAPGDDGYIRFRDYTIRSQFGSDANQSPTLSRLLPSLNNTTLGSSGVAPTAQTFTFAVKDEDGTGDIESLWFLAGKERSWTSSATFIYQPRTRRLFLRSDDGNSFLGGGRIGSAGTIENSQVRVDLSKVKTTFYPGGKTLSLVLPLQAKSGLLGQNKIWLRTQDRRSTTAPGSDDQGYVLSGSWNVAPSTAPGSATALSAGNS